MSDPFSSGFSTGFGSGGYGTPEYYTSKDLVREALWNLGVISASQTEAPEDYNYVAQRLNAIFRKLGALEIVYIADGGNIPAEWFLDLAAIVAGEVATKFGSGDDYISTLVNGGLGGWGPVPIGAGTAARSLKIMTRGRPTGEPQRTDSF